MVLFFCLLFSSNTWCWSVGHTNFCLFCSNNFAQLCEQIELTGFVNFCQYCKFLPVLLDGKTNFLWKSYITAMRFFIYRFIQGGSRSSQVIISLGTKLDMIFITVSLKIETCSLTSTLLSKDSQPNRLMAFFIQSEFARGKCHTVL